jgi:hypothetical protein
MLMQMLGAGGMPLLTDGTRPPDEDNPRGYFELDAVKRTADNVDWVDDAVGQAVKVIHLLLPRLPPRHHDRVLFMHRDLAEILASQQQMLARLGRRGADLPPERLGLVLASQAHQVLRWLATQPNFHVLDVEHRQVVGQPAAQARRINTFLGGRLNEQAMAAAVDPGLYRRRSSTPSP